MQRRIRLIVAVLALSALASVAFAQFYRRGYAPAVDQPLVGEPKEWTFARLAYDGNGFRGGSGWAVDYPRAEEHFSQAVDRLTRIDVHPDGHVISPNSDDLFNYPWLYAVEVWSWSFSDSQAERMREYLLRGGFLLCDSFYGTVEWDGFIASLQRVFPDRPIVELPDTHPIFHAVYDLTNRPQIPTWQHLPRGGYRNDGAVAHWRAILDDDERVMVMITFNNDVADGWQRADEYDYPQEAANLAISLGVNFAVYALSH